MTGLTQTEDLPMDELDPSLDYRESIPMGHSTSWIADENLKPLIKHGVEVALGEGDHEVRFALEAVLVGDESEDWMASEYGGYWMVLGEVEEAAEEYRKQTFGLDKEP